MTNPIINALKQDPDYKDKITEIDEENYVFKVDETHSLEIHTKKPSTFWPVLNGTEEVKRDKLSKPLKSEVTKFTLAFNTLKVEGIPEDKFLTAEETPVSHTDPHCEVVIPKTRQTTLPAVSAPQTVSVSSRYDFTADQITAMKYTVAKGATDAEFEMFLYLAKRYELDPFLHEIYFAANMKTIITSRDGYLKYAHRHKDFEGIRSMAVCANDDFEIDLANDTVRHKFGKGERGPVIGAWAIVYRKGRRPVIAYADLKEYKKTGGAWQYVSAMICKCAEAFALKRQFAISGLVTQEEMGIDETQIIDAQYVVRDFDETEFIEA